MFTAPITLVLVGLDRLELVVDETGRASQVVYFVHLHIEWESDIVAYDCKVAITGKVSYVSFGAGEEVVDADYVARRIMAF